MGRQSFLKGAFILAFASVLIRTIGFIYQIIIIRLIGTEGIGIFNMVYPLYITALVFVTAGLPLAISKFISEEKSYNKATSENLLSVSITVLILISTIVSLLLVLFSPYLIRVIYTDSRVIPSFLILVPTLLLCAVSSAIKSFFQGKQDMRPTAQSQLIEQIIRFITGLILVYLLYPLGLTWAAVGLSIGILISEIGGFVYLRNSFRKYSPTAKLVTTPSSKVIIKLFSFGIPVTITRLVSTFLIAAEASLIPRQLIKVGSTLSQATSFYGELTGVAFTLLMVPSTLSFALATSIVPAVSEAGSLNNKNELRQKSTEAINITLLAGVPSVLILYFWGSIISSLLFKAELGGQLLQILTLGGIFLYVAQTSTGILQGIGCVKTIFFITLFCGIMRLGGIYYFGSQPDYYISGIAFSYVFSFVATALLNILIIRKKGGLQLEPLFFVRISIAGLILIKMLNATANLIQNNIILLILLVLAHTIVYFFLLLIMGDKYSRLILNQLFKANSSR